MDAERIDLDQVRAVLKIASEATDIAELTVETPTLKVSVKKAGSHTEIRAQTNPGSHPAGAASAVPSAERAGAGLAAGGGPTAGQPVTIPVGELALPDNMKAVTAPMVGTFYRSPSPDAAPFVNEGDQVDTGQTVCIIEAMKLFNEIQSDVRGRVARVLVENGTPVEYGQPLLLIEPPA